MQSASKRGRKRSEAKAPIENEDATFLAGYDPSEFERPSVAVDVALITLLDDTLAALLIERDAPPFRGRLSLPGTFVRMDESLEAAAARVLLDKAGLKRVFLEQLYTFGSPSRDPRTRVLSVTYVALVSPDVATDLERFYPLDIPWEGETGGPVGVLDGERKRPLAFDHDDILGMAVKRLRGKLDYTPIGFQLLPTEFTLLMLQRLHETVLARPVNKDSFRRRMLASGDLESTGTRETDTAHRPAELYRFARRSAV